MNNIIWITHCRVHSQYNIVYTNQPTKVFLYDQITRELHQWSGFGVATDTVAQYSQTTHAAGISMGWTRFPNLFVTKYVVYLGTWE